MLRKFMALGKPAISICARAVLLAVGLYCLWAFLAVILAAQRGLDITDEALYLLAADPPNARATWGFPFGWHTGQLFHLVGYDIAAFRTLGAFLLVLSGAWFGYWAAIAALRGIVYESTGAAQERRQFIAMVVVLAAAGSLMFYAGLLRTPAYNWLGLAGIYIGAGGVLGLWASTAAPDTSGVLRESLLLIMATSLGLFLTLPAKPSIAPMLLCAAVTLFLLSGRSLKPLFWVGAALLVSPAIAAMIGLWPPDWIGVFSNLLTSERPSLLPDHNVLGAVLSLLSVPVDFFADLRSIGSLPLMSIASAFCLIIASSVAGRYSRRMACCGILILAGCALLICRALNPLLAHSDPVNRWIFVPVSTANLVLLAGCLGVAVATSIRGGKRGASRLLDIVLLVGFLAVLPFIFAFGSGHGAYTQTFLAVGIFPVAALVALSAVPFRRSIRVAALAVCAFSLVCVTGTLVDSWRRPYRCEPIAHNQESVEIGPHGASLLLTPELAGFFRDMREQMTREGWVVGTPLIALTWTWGTAIPYALGAAVPDSLMVTIFGYPNSAKHAKFNLNQFISQSPSNQAWIVVGDLRPLMPGDPKDWKGPIGTEDVSKSGEIWEVLNAFQEASGRSLSKDYTSFPVSGSIIVWKPKTPSGD
jgi:hypothetical protein